MSVPSIKEFISRRNCGLRNGGVCKDGHRAISTNRCEHRDLLTLLFDRFLCTQAMMKHLKFDLRYTYARLMQREFQTFAPLTP